jgi:two-component system phosphate regulon sensor histidine kinase PhoR
MSPATLRTLAIIILPGVALVVALALLGVIGWGWALACAGLLAGGQALLIGRRLLALDRTRRRLMLLAGLPQRARGFFADDDARALDRIADQRTEAEARAAAQIAAAEAVIDAIPDPLLVVERARVVVQANAAARALFGPAEGRELAAVLRDPGLIEAVETIGPDGPPQAVEFMLAGAVERIFGGYVANLPPAADGTLRVLVVLTDRTAIKRADRVRADFVANVSHEMRTPLASLSGFIETLRGAARDDVEARDRFLAIMNEQANRMGRLVADLLSLTRIEQDEHTLPAERVAVGKILRGVADALLPTARAKGMTIAVDSMAGLPPVIGDGDQLTQVFQNLVENAIKYGRPDTAVAVTTRLANRPPGHARLPASVIAIAVADQGEGIAREHLPRLTERFYRVDTGRSRALGGTGLGLAIVKHIVNRHRGALTIDSELGKGSTFTVYLPAAAQDAKARAAGAR